MLPIFGHHVIDIFLFITASDNGPKINIILQPIVAGKLIFLASSENYGGNFPKGYKKMFLPF
jgi:hypothetical protein